MSNLSDKIALLEADLKLARLHAAVLNARECLNATLRDMTEAERINFEHRYGKGAYQIGDFIIREITDFEPRVFKRHSINAPLATDGELSELERTRQIAELKCKENAARTPHAVDCGCFDCTL